RAAQHGRDIGARRGVAMRAFQIFLVVIALVAVGVAGWALGSRGGYGQPEAGPAAVEDPSSPARHDSSGQRQVAGGGHPAGPGSPPPAPAGAPSARPPAAAPRRPPAPTPAGPRPSRLPSRRYAASAPSRSRRT